MTGPAARLMATWSRHTILDDPADDNIVYIAGPMTIVGPPTWNYPAFYAKAAELRAAGHTVIINRIERAQLGFDFGGN